MSSERIKELEAKESEIRAQRLALVHAAREARAAVHSQLAELNRRLGDLDEVRTDCLIGRTIVGVSHGSSGYGDDMDITLDDGTVVSIEGSFDNISEQCGLCVGIRGRALDDWLSKRIDAEVARVDELEGRGQRASEYAAARVGEAER